MTRGYPCLCLTKLPTREIAHFCHRFKQANKKNKIINHFIIQVDLDSHWLLFFLLILFVADNQEKLHLAIPHDVLFSSDRFKSHFILLLGRGRAQEDLSCKLLRIYLAPFV